MGGMGSKPKITKYTPLFAEVLRCNILEIDRIFVLVDDVIDVGEKIRNQVISSRELIIRITKVHHFQNPQILDAFKVWTWVVGICNDGTLDGIEFKADWNDVGKMKKKKKHEEENAFEQLKDAVEDAAEEAVDTVKKGFGALMDFGKKAIKKIEKKVEAVIEGKKFVEEDQEEPAKIEGPKTAFGTVGKCKDFRMEVFPGLIARFIEGVRMARDFFPQVVDKLNFYVEKVKQMKDDIPRLKALMESMTGMQQIKTIGIIAADVVQFGVAIEVAKNFEKMIPDLVKEVEAFLEGYERVLESERSQVDNLYRNVGNRKYYKNEEQ